MRRITLLLLALIAISIHTKAQGGAVQKTAKAVFSINTFKADGSLLASSHGVFINYDGTAIAPLKPFQGAAKATVVDANGRTSNVDIILAFNELYDMCKFRVSGNAPAVSRVASSQLTTGGHAWLLPYSIKTPDIAKAEVTKVEKFNTSYNYYIFQVNTSMNTEGCPFVNDNGEVIGLLKHTENDLVKNAADLNFLNTMKLNGLSINDPSLAGCGIRVGLPDDLNQAELTMMVAKSKYDRNTFTKYTDEFIKRFPNSATGYQERALLAVEEGSTSEADKYINTALNLVSDKAMIHSIYSNMIYKYNISREDSSYTKWNLDLALAEAKTAYKIKNQPAYKLQEGQILYSQKKYQEAYDIFMGLTKSGLRNPELFFQAAQCKTQMKAPEDEVYALVDSAVVKFPKDRMTAPYYLIRGQLKEAKGLNREAVKDYNVYDTLMLGRADHSFYYMRYKCEMKIRWWQQALQDIAHAININPKEPTYHAEMASLALKVNEPKLALNAARQVVALDKDYTEGHLLLGIAMAENNDKAGGIAELEKAKSMGDSRAQQFIDKYNK